MDSEDNRNRRDKGDYLQNNIIHVHKDSIAINKTRESLKWRRLLYDYSQNTTMHGIRYTTIKEHFLRRLLWILVVACALLLFTYLAFGKLVYLLGNPKGVNVEVNYADSLPFPVVTICNDNRYRLTSLFESGVYDLMVHKPDYEDPTGVMVNCTKDAYYYYDDVCTVAIGRSKWTKEMIRTTRKVCEHLCSHTYDDTCSGYYYVRRTQTCMLTSSTHDTLKPGSPTLTCDPAGIEFYRRYRCLGIKTIVCDFEHKDTCNLDKDDHEEEQWLLVQAQGHSVTTDSSIGMESGHFLYAKELSYKPALSLFSATKPPQMRTVAVWTPYFTAQNYCISLAYWPLGDAPAILSVNSQNEERKIKTVIYKSELESRDEVRDWIWIRAKLPDDILKVKLSALRVANKISGLAVDDIEIKPCSELEQRECLVTRSGIDYIGKVSQTSRGKPCANWTALGFLGYSLDRLPDGDVVEAGNMCRNIPGLGWTTPMCYIEGDMTQPQPCHIPYCACGKDSYQCATGVCVPSEVTCDGVDDCADSSDETYVCEDKRKFECDFEDDFMCGWKSSLTSGHPDWLRHKGPGFSDVTSPKTDSKSSKQGYYIYLDSRIFLKGKKVALITPRLSIRQPLRFTFNLHMNILKSDRLAKLQLFKTNEVELAQQILWESDEYITEGWREVEVVLPGEDSYSLMFQATAGQSFQSDIAIDDARVQSIGIGYPFDWGGNKDDLFCRQQQHPCSLYTWSSNAFFSWAQAPKTSVGLDPSLQNNTKGDCGETFTDLEGTMSSPGYPNEYPTNATCIYTLLLPHVSVVTINLILVDLQQESGICVDYIQFEINGTLQERKNCRISDQATHVFKGEQFSVIFKSTMSGANKRFLLSYKITPPDVADVALVLKQRLPEGMGKTFDDESSILFTEQLNANEVYCLSMTVYVTLTLTVDIIYEYLGDVRRDNVFVTKGLGNAWHKLNLYNIAPTYKPVTGTFRLNLRVNSSSRMADGLVGVSSIQTQVGSCEMDRREEWSVCEFDDLDQCGWTDTSDVGSSRWHRVHRYADYSDKQGDIFSLNVALRRGENSSVSNQFYLDREKCLSVKYQIKRRSRFKRTNFDPNSKKKYRFFLSSIVTKSWGAESVITRGFHADLNRIITDRLGPGLNMVTLKVSVPDNGLSTELEDYYLQVDEMQLSERACDTGKASASIQCEFAATEDCGYHLTQWEKATLFDGREVVSLSGSSIPGWLTSPVTRLTMSLEAMVAAHVEEGELTVYALSGGAPQHLMANIKQENYNTTEEDVTNICLPNGTYSLLFLGQPIYGKMHMWIDYVRFKSQCSAKPGQLDIFPGNQYNLACTFDGGSCSYIPFAELPASWRFSDVGVSLTTESTEAYGYLFSPVIRVNSSDKLCLKISLDINSPLTVTKLSLRGGLPSTRTLLLSVLPDIQLVGVTNIMSVNVQSEVQEEIQVEISMVAKGKHSPLIREMYSEFGSCDFTDAEPSGWLRCYFDDPNLCGLKQNMGTHSAWLRKKSTENPIDTFFVESCVTTAYSTFISSTLGEEEREEDSEWNYNVPYSLLHESRNLDSFYPQYNNYGYSPLPSYCVFLNINKLHRDVKLVIRVHTSKGISTYEDGNGMCNTGAAKWTKFRVDMEDVPERVEVTAVPLRQDDTPKCVQIHEITVGPSDMCQAIQCHHPAPMDNDEIRDKVALPVDALLGYEQILHDVGEIDMMKFEVAAGHSYEDTSYLCAWGGKRCDASLLSTKLTERGKCFTFNAENKLSTYLTGANHGVQFIINVEDYQQIKEFHENKGIKVHLHGSDDLENVQNQGFAVGPNDHAFVACKYSTTESLGHPYGSCSHKPMLHHHGDYSKLKCMRECMIESQKQRCGCKEPYLDGTYKTCTFKEERTCRSKTVPDAFSSETDLTVGCNCPENCTVMSYSLELSSGKLSSWSDAEIRQIKERLTPNFHEALEIRHRIDKNNIADSLVLMSNTSDLFAAYHKILQNIFSADQSTTLNKVVKGIMTVNNLTRGIRREDLFRNFEQKRDTYLTNLNPSVEYSVSALENVAEKSYLLRDCITHETGIKNINESYNGLNTSIGNMLLALPMTIRKLVASSSDLPDCRSIAADHKNCHIEDLFFNMKKLVSTLPPLSEVALDNRTEDKLSSLGYSARHMAQCLLSYCTFLDRTSDWLREDDLMTYDREFSLDTEQLLKYQSKFDSLIDEYRMDNKTFLQVCEEVLGFVDQIQTLLDETVEGVDNSIHPLLTFLINMEERLIENIRESFKTSVRWQSFVPRFSDISRWGRASRMWRKPVVDLDNTNGIINLYGEEDVGRVWSSNQGLRSFLTNTGGFIIKDTIRGIIDDYRTPVHDIKERTKKQTDQIKRQITMVTEVMSEYINGAVIGENFIRKNFLKLDIYYGELKYEKVTQYPAYDLLTYFGDMGGYMGLLLGCSVITIVELMDLFIYSGIRKCARRLRKSN